MQKLVPSLWFNNNCEEAINFYVSIFKNSRIISMQKYPDHPVEGLPMEGMQGKVLTAVFELEGQRFLALDGGPVFQPSGAISFYIECDTQEEIDHYWGRLTEGGDPGAQQCGWLKDKFGFSWQVAPKVLGELLSSPDKEKADRVMKAMLQMKKIDIPTLEQAANS